jgi:hypothetical protein
MDSIRSRLAWLEMDVDFICRNYPLFPRYAKDKTVGRIRTKIALLLYYILGFTL